MLLIFWHLLSTNEKRNLLEILMAATCQHQQKGNTSYCYFVMKNRIYSFYVLNSKYLLYKNLIIRSFNKASLNMFHNEKEVRK